MLDQEALPAINLLDGWGWQRPVSISAAEYESALAKCAEVLIDNPAGRAYDAAELKMLLEKSNRRLFACMSDFRRSYGTAELEQRKKIFEHALAQCCNRFERRIMAGAADADDKRAT